MSVVAAQNHEASDAERGWCADQTDNAIALAVLQPRQPVRRDEHHFLDVSIGAVKSTILIEWLPVVVFDVADCERIVCAEELVPHHLGTGRKERDGFAGALTVTPNALCVTVRPPLVSVALLQTPCVAFSKGPTVGVPTGVQAIDSSLTSRWWNWDGASSGRFEDQRLVSRSPPSRLRPRT